MCSVRQLADATLPSLKLNMSPPTCLPLSRSSCLRCAHFFFFFTPSSQISPPLLPVRQISSLFIVSQPVSTPRLSLSAFLPASFLIEHLGSALQGFILLPLLHHLFLPLHSVSRRASRCQSVCLPLRLYPSARIFTSPSSRW